VAIKIVKYNVNKGLAVIKETKLPKRGYKRLKGSKNKSK